MKDEEEVQEELEAELLEEELIKERRGRKLKCTCQTDGPQWCDLHGDFSGF